MMLEFPNFILDFKKSMLSIGDITLKNYNYTVTTEYVILAQNEHYIFTLHPVHAKLPE